MTDHPTQPADGDTAIRLAAEEVQRQLVQDLLPQVIQDGIERALTRINQARVKKRFETFSLLPRKDASAQSLVVGSKLRITSSVGCYYGRRTTTAAHET